MRTSGTISSSARGLYLTRVKAAHGLNASLRARGIVPGAAGRAVIAANRARRAANPPAAPGAYAPTSPRT